ncbi:hypothetical protein PCASD_00720 [Puccinia coronata f. sp. avenae]|uniref:Uncharacterized protein n=1 Tax=Puccinia coronata f. sp. avenae TaxID=200324 RepID=A0A2N5VLA1_9BASI|nr:hypothetical protein PCASD_00720 [Puccinia coronata f. sp. avenae]
MHHATPSSCRASASTNTHRSSSPYPLKSCCRALAHMAPIKQPAFVGSHGQPIVIDNPVLAPAAELPTFHSFQAPPGLGSPILCPEIPCSGLDSPGFRPETLRPANLASPVFSSDEENHFVDQLTSPAYQPASPACAFPNGDGQFAGNPGPFLVHQAMIGNGWAPAPETTHKTEISQNSSKTLTICISRANDNQSKPTKPNIVPSSLSNHISLMARK